MMAEDYVSFEVAKLLKEKGFNELTPLSYSLPYGYESHIPCRNGVDTDFVSRITLQMAMKWLRKVHEIFIRPNINFLYPIRYYCEIFCYGDNLKTQQDVTTENFESPEEACEEAIKYCLEKLI